MKIQDIYSKQWNKVMPWMGLQIWHAIIVTMQKPKNLLWDPMIIMVPVFKAVYFMPPCKVFNPQQGCHGEELNSLFRCFCDFLKGIWHLQKLVCELKEIGNHYLECIYCTSSFMFVIFFLISHLRWWLVEYSSLWFDWLIHSSIQYCFMYPWINTTPTYLCCRKVQSIIFKPTKKLWAPFFSLWVFFITS